MFIAASLWIDRPSAYADAIAVSSLSASNLTIAAEGPGIVSVDPLFQTLALAHAQNTLGDVDDEFDFEIAAPAATSASVTWANGSSTSSDTTWTANSTAHIVGVDGEANSSGQGQLFATLEVDCPGCVGSTTVDFSVDLTGLLQVQTDKFGELARAETIFNLLVNGDTLLFRDDILSIGPNGLQTLSFAPTLTGKMTLTYGTPYDLVLRVDSESEVINAFGTVPEPASVTLLCLGFGALGALRVRRRRSNGSDPS
jgi:hypothetical protein